jgi:hypothetical protein
MLKYNIDDKGAWFKLNSSEYLISNTDPNFHTLVGIILYSGYSEDKKDELISDKLSDSLVSKYIDPSKIVSYGLTGEKTYNGIPLKKLSDQIKDFISSGVPEDSIMTMVEMTRTQVMADLIATGLTGYHISKTGNLLFYKGIQENWKDCQTGTIKNRIGKTIEMPRDKCVKGYGPGLHVSNFEHAKGYGKRIVLVRVKPENIFEVGNPKIKVVKYKVLKEVTTPYTSFILDDKNLK